MRRTGRSDQSFLCRIWYYAWQIGHKTDAGCAVSAFLPSSIQQLVKSLQADKGRDLLKQVRTRLIETARPVLEAMVQEVTGVKMLSLHHDISTATGEEIVLLTLAEFPLFRNIKGK